MHLNFMCPSLRRLRSLIFLVAVRIEDALHRHLLKQARARVLEQLARLPFSFVNSDSSTCFHQSHAHLLAYVSASCLQYLLHQRRVGSILQYASYLLIQPLLVHERKKVP